MRLSQLVLATDNGGKVVEFKEMLEREIEVVTLEDLKLFMPELDEVCDTFPENARLKAYATLGMLGNELVRRCDSPFAVIAEDSGIVVPALSGFNGGPKDFPGVRSKRWHAGNDQDRNAELLRIIESKKLDNKAQMVCAIALVGPSHSICFKGVVHGHIVRPEGNNGFGYDPIFQVLDTPKPLGEMTLEHKNMLSHRRRAIDELLYWLKKERKATT